MASTIKLPSEATLLRVDPGTGALQSREYHLSVVSGPDAGKSVAISGTTVVGTALGAALLLTDEAVSAAHVELSPRTEGVRIRDLGSTNGTFIGGARIGEALLEEPGTVRVGRTVLRIAIIDERVGVPETAVELAGAIGRSLVMRRLFGMISRVAPTRSPVVLLGETGTGKEVLARAVHARSPRAQRPFVVFDCAAVAPSLIESALFGHVKGAFTGATSDRKGAFGEADGGTLFLDELGELATALQPKLLRALEEGTITPVGGDAPRRVDVRVIAATHRDLEAEVAASRFRSDLYFRLCVVPLHVPPLRERPEDIPALAEHFVRQLGAPEVSLPAASIARLCAYDWPGNVRELRNVIARALVDDAIVLGPARTSPPPAAGVSTDLPFKAAKERLIDGFTRDYLEAMLARHAGNITHAAKAAGIARAHLHKLVEKYGLKCRRSIGAPVSAPRDTAAVADVRKFGRLRRPRWPVGCCWATP